MNAASPSARPRLGSRVASQRPASSDLGAALVLPPSGGSSSRKRLSVDPSEAQRDSAHAFKAAGVIGSSLLVTQAIGFLGNNIVVTRLLKEHYGPVRFADSFAMLSMMALNLGVDTYVRKEVAVRPDHAREFASGVLGARIILGVGFMLVSFSILIVTHRPPVVIALALLFCVGQLLQHLSETSAAYLQAVGSVREASIMRVGSKLAWAVVAIGGVVAGLGVWIVPAAMVVSEGSKAIVLGLLSRRRLQLRFRLDAGARQATWTVLVASLPFLMTHINTVLSATLDVSMVGFLTNNDEVGFYGSATNIALVALVLAPVISWVLLPLLSRSLARSEEEFWRVVCRSLEIVLTIAVPLSVLLSLNADVVIKMTIGSFFSPAVPALRVLAPMFVLTYVTILCASGLIRLGRGWFIARVGIAAVAFNVILNLVLIRRGLSWWGSGGAGTGASISIVIAEAFVASSYVYALGRKAFDRRSLRTIGITLVASVFIVALDRTMLPLCRSVPVVRPIVDTGLFLAHLLGLGVIRPSELRRLVKGGGFS